MIQMIKNALMGMMFFSTMAYATPNHEVAIQQIANLVLSDNAMNLRVIAKTFNEPDLYEKRYNFYDKNRLYHPYEINNSQSVIQEINHRIRLDEDLGYSVAYGEAVFRFRTPCPDITTYEKVLGKSVDKLRFPPLPPSDGGRVSDKYYTVYYIALNDSKRLKINPSTCEVSYHSEAKLA